MKTPLTEDQKKRVQLIAAASAFAGLIIGTVITIFLKDKQIDKLEAKIFKLEGWQ